MKTAKTAPFSTNIIYSPQKSPADFNDRYIDLKVINLIFKQMNS
jgi:hypothetical protein